ncbi:hypothetical protein GGI21_004204, partial [Coemansia aciculifera]
MLATVPTTQMKPPLRQIPTRKNARKHARGVIHEAVRAVANLIARKAAKLVVRGLTTSASSENSSSQEYEHSSTDAPVERKKSDDVYVEIVNSGSSSDSESNSEGNSEGNREGNREDDSEDDSEGENGSVASIADASANSSLDVVTHTNTDSAGVIVDSNPLLVGSQAQHPNGDATEEGHDDGFLNDANIANNMPPAGPGSVAELTMLDYLSQRVIDEINAAVQALDDESNMASGQSAIFQRLDCYAHEQVLIRNNHFTRQLFITSDQRPHDDDDILQWISSLQRINMATLLLLVVRPSIVVANPVRSSMPNRERMICSLGLGSAARGLFSSVAPPNLRNAETVDLLVDLITQQLLAAANDEDHLQTLVSDERSMSDAEIAQLLSIEDGDATSNATDRPDVAHFDARALSLYRKELGRRLNRISGGRLRTARSLYTPQALWKKLVAFCAQCSTSWRAPSILSEQQSRQADISFNALDDVDELTDGADDSGRDIVLDDAHQDAEVTAADEAANVSKANTAPIDPSFREERRVASILREVQVDSHLGELLEVIEPEHIDISDQQVQSHTPRRVRPARRHVFAQVPNYRVEEANNGNESDN